LEKSHGGAILLPVSHAHEQARLYDNPNPRTQVVDPKIHRAKKEGGGGN